MVLYCRDSGVTIKAVIVAAIGGRIRPSPAAARCETIAAERPFADCVRLTSTAPGRPQHKECAMILAHRDRIRSRRVGRVVPF
jgi:hypothetical protein